MINLKKYWKVWTTSASLSIQSNIIHRFSAAFFISGKFIRFILFIIFLKVISHQLQVGTGYSYKEMLTFFLVFNLFDIFGQVFFRGIYWFRQQIISGEFDFRLVKPMNPLFQALTRHTDILDLPLIIIVIAMLFVSGLPISPDHLDTFLLLTLSGFLIITAIHIIVASLGVITTEVDHTIMIYRDLSAMARFPIDIYIDFIRAFLTFVVPIGLAFTYPAKAIMGLLSTQTTTLTILASLITFIISLAIWKYALTKYSSASS